MLVAGYNPLAIRVKAEASTRLQRDWRTLSSQNSSLFYLVSCLAGYCNLIIGKPIIITQIHRTQAEQEAIYGKNTKRKSPHQFYMAVDLRSRSPFLNDIERRRMESALRAYDTTNKFKPMQSGSKTV